ncbi:MAG TPA: PQQ-binding-like beta-propeller repeat protein, partial [Alphaproteobacteria bacterium]
AGTVLALQGCASEEEKQKPLPGNRVSVLEWQQHLTTDKEAMDEPVNLPPARTNQFWAQAGGIADHSMRHLSLSPNKLKKVWSRSIGEGSDRDHRLVTTPIVVDQTIYAMDTEGKITALRMTDGKELWQVNIIPDEEEPTALTGGLAFDDGKLFVADGFGFLLALDPSSGKKIWQVTLNVPARASPTVADGKVYVVTLANELIALSGQDGQVLWRHQGDQAMAGLLGAPSPAVVGNTIIVTYSTGDVIALRVENGEESWSDNVTGLSTQRGATKLSDIRGLPVVDNDRVYVANASSRMMAIDLRTGDRAWQRDFGTLNTPWAGGGFVFLLTAQDDVVALRQGDGKMRWATALNNKKKDKDEPTLWVGPVLAGNRLIVAGSNEELIEINPDDGKIIRRTDIGINVQIPPIVAHDTLLLLDDDGVLNAYR